MPTVTVALLGVCSTCTACSRSAPPVTDHRISTYDATDDTGLAARFEGALTIQGDCLGMVSDTGFSPVVLPADAFRFDDGGLTFQGVTTPLGGKLVAGGGSLRQPLPSTGDLRMARGCTSFPDAIFLNASRPF